MQEAFLYLLTVILVTFINLLNKYQHDIYIYVYITNVYYPRVLPALQKYLNIADLIYLYSSHILLLHTSIRTRILYKVARSRHCETENVRAV